MSSPGNISQSRVQSQIQAFDQKGQQAQAPAQGKMGALNVTHQVGHFPPPPASWQLETLSNKLEEHANSINQQGLGGELNQLRGRISDLKHQGQGVAQSDIQNLARDVDRAVTLGTLTTGSSRMRRKLADQKAPKTRVRPGNQKLPPVPPRVGTVEQKKPMAVQGEKAEEVQKQEEKDKKTFNNSSKDLQTNLGILRNNAKTRAKTLEKLASSPDLTQIQKTACQTAATTLNDIADQLSTMKDAQEPFDALQGNFQSLLDKTLKVFAEFVTIDEGRPNLTDNSDQKALIEVGQYCATIVSQLEMPVKEAGKVSEGHPKHDDLAALAKQISEQSKNYNTEIGKLADQGGREHELSAATTKLDQMRELVKTSKSSKSLKSKQKKALVRDAKNLRHQAAVDLAQLKIGMLLDNRPTGEKLQSLSSEDSKAIKMFTRDCEKILEDADKFRFDASQFQSISGKKALLTELRVAIPSDAKGSLGKLRAQIRNIEESMTSLSSDLSYVAAPRATVDGHKEHKATITKVLGENQTAELLQDLNQKLSSTEEEISLLGKDSKTVVDESLSKQLKTYNDRIPERLEQRKAVLGGLQDDLQSLINLAELDDSPGADDLMTQLASSIEEGQKLLEQVTSKPTMGHDAFPTIPCGIPQDLNRIMLLAKSKMDAMEEGSNKTAFRERLNRIQYAGPNVTDAIASAIRLQGEVNSLAMGQLDASFFRSKEVQRLSNSFGANADQEGIREAITSKIKEKAKAKGMDTSSGVIDQLKTSGGTYTVDDYYALVEQALNDIDNYDT